MYTSHLFYTAALHCMVYTVCGDLVRVMAWCGHSWRMWLIILTHDTCATYSTPVPGLLPVGSLHGRALGML